MDYFYVGLPYVAPKPLLGSSGLTWEYQAGPALLQTLQTGIRDHYKSYRSGNIDKITMPLYLFLSGAGTGKSRNASEFHRTVVECLGDEDEELKNKFRNAWVFHVSLENGSTLRDDETSAFRAVGNRMLLQLLPEKALDQIVTSYEAPDPMEVLRLVAKHEKQELKDATIIVVVDGMQNLMTSYEDGLNAESRFYKTLSSTGDLAHKGAFLLPCCTATVSRPIDQSLRTSNRCRIYLPVTSLEPPVIRQDHGIELAFPIDSSLMKILVEDCGGHGRALEILWNLTRGLNLENCDVGDLMRKLRNNLSQRYKSALPNDEDAKAIVRAILVHQRLINDEHIPNTSKFPDQVVAPGLIRYEEVGQYGYLHVPYIWLWIIAETGGRELLLPGWRFDDYTELLANEDKTLPSNCSWENFEKFNARFRAMKSLALEEGQLTKISEMNFGARLNGDINFVNHHLSVACAVNQTDTRTTEANSVEWIVNSLKESINMRQHRHIVINAKSATASDAFLSLDAQPPTNENHQYKFFTDANISNDLYNRERNIAASNRDFFIFFTTQKTPDNIKLPPNSGIVDQKNWNDYFGPFAGRAFVYGLMGAPNINTADFTTLQLVDGVGPATARKIMVKRKFSSIEDAEEKTKLRRVILEQFQY
ncbi:hypothetical protein BC938DRAFT_480973 [Jimgerdemannia flammicorona]|uniref:Uncharacterized protein n=1 Tax=Jimgerdemannia flammicorona TaxID=994334 RepID=A0A433QH94_9FUNG|nr:hypothetical protein BC938DRAFT_480973 [Jimgerdemannia flammicorona]